MAKFNENVLEFQDISTFCRIPVSYAGDQWFLNVGKNSVVNVHDQKTLHTWTLMHPHYFTSPVLHSEGYLYCIMDKNVLIKWSVEEDNFKNAEKIKFQDSVFAVIPVERAQPLILFDSGKYALISSNFHDTKPSDFVFLKENEELIWADACVTAKEIEVFYWAYNQKEENRNLYYFTINKKNYSHSSRLSHKIYRKNAVLKSWCLNHHNFLFLSLWSDGMMCSHNIKESKTTNLLTIKNIETNIVIDIDSIDSTHIAVGRAHLNQEGCMLEIWDSKCAILKAKKILKTPSVNCIQIAVIKSNLFLYFNNELISVTFQVEDPTFFAAIGMSESDKYIQHSWNTDLELIPIPDNEPESMDICSNQDSQDSLECVAEKLMKQNTHDLMCITESELIKLLKVVIRHKKKENNDKQSPEKDMYSLLNIIFSASFSDVLLVKYLKRMNLEETLIVLEWLLSFLNHTENMPSNDLKRASDLQIINWTCLIIQSHTEALLFSKDKASQKLLKQLEKALSIKMEEYEDFNCLQSYFSIIEKKDILPQRCSVGKYSIESLEI